MLRRSLTLAGALVALSATSASATTMFVFRLGTHTAARTNSGCHFHALAGGELTTTCGAGHHASLTYAFTLPADVGTVYPVISGSFRCWGQRRVTAVMDRVTRRTIHEVIAVPGSCTAAINSVRINYLTPV